MDGVGNEGTCMSAKDFDKSLCDLINKSIDEREGSLAEIIAALDYRKTELIYNTLSNSAHTPAPSVSGDEQADKPKTEKPKQT